MENCPHIFTLLRTNGNRPARVNDISYMRRFFKTRCTRLYIIYFTYLVQIGSFKCADTRSRVLHNLRGVHTDNAVRHNERQQPDVHKQHYDSCTQKHGV